MSPLIAFLVVVAFVTAGHTVNMPQFLKACKRNDPKLSECFTSSVQAAFPTLAGGIPELEIPVLDPQDLGEVILSTKKGNGKGIDIDLKLKNAKSNGLKTFKLIDGASVDLKNRHHKVVGRMTALQFEGQYMIDGTVLQKPIKGEGDATITIEYDIIFNSDMTFIEGRGGKQYIKYQDPKVEFKPKSFNIHLDNLFNGDKKLGDKMNAVLNNNWQEVLEELTPAFRDICSNQVLLIINGLAKHIPLDVLFP